MLTFNLLLEAAGINTKDVYLVRHKDTRVPKYRLRSRHSSPYELWANENTRSKFDVYQKLQRNHKNIFGKRNIIASFVVTPWNETLFCGLYRKLGVGKLPTGLKECPVSGKKVTNQTHLYYYLELMKELKGKVIVGWGDGFRSWVQRANLNNKPVLELRKEVIDYPFPGFREFEWDIADIENTPQEWKKQLTQSKGIYLQRCTQCGALYVGKADGEDGFMGRFREYAKSVHCGNIGMKAHPHSSYKVRVLEVFPSRYIDDTSKIESEWKKTLGTFEWGLNKNL